MLAGDHIDTSSEEGEEQYRQNAKGNRKTMKLTHQDIEDDEAQQTNYVPGKGETDSEEELDNEMTELQNMI